MTILQFRSEGTGGSGSGPFYNIMNVSTSDGAEQATVDGVAGLLHTFYTNLAGLYPNTITWQAAERVTSVAIPAAIYVPTSMPAPVHGSAPSAAAPQLAAVVSWVTGLAGSRYRGRTYIGPLATLTFATDGTITPANAATIQSAAQGLLTGIPGLDIGGGAAFLGVYSRKFNTIQAVTNSRVDLKVDTQRRRN